MMRRMQIKVETAGLMRKFSASNAVLLIICLMYLILYVDRVNISTAAPLIKADLDLTNTQLGLAFSAFAYPYALFQLIGGYFGDRFGPRLTLCVCSLIVCAATAATGVVGGFASLFAARLALGVGEGATFPRRVLCRYGRRSTLGALRRALPIRPRGSAMQ
jgi:MFS family permease